MHEDDVRPPSDTDTAGRSGFSRRRFFAFSGAAGAAAALVPDVAAAATSPTISQENAQTGALPEQWESDDSTSIVGFTTEYSVLPGQRVDFKIKTDSRDYVVRIYRLGWYGGRGARWLQDVSPTATLPQSQPEPKTEASSGLVDCGNWAVSASWTVPTGAVSGVYYAKMQRRDGDASSSHTIFVVRRQGPSDVLVQTSEMTMHAYNRYGGNSLYFGQPVGRSFKVSYNRPFGEGDGLDNDFFNAEYPLVRFLERNGYDVAYCGGIDVHRDASVLQGRKIFVSSGHDEYVTGAQRTNVTAARDAGTHLIFMTGNEYFWRVRTAPSIDGASTPDRTIVCYKETLDGAKTDPSSEWTGTWRDPRFTTKPNGNFPENELTGQLFVGILPGGEAPNLALRVPRDYAPLRFWRGTDVAALQAGQSATLAQDSLGYEFDVDADNGFRPGGIIHLSETSASAPQILRDHGKTYTEGVVVHTMTLYRAPSKALVWGTGTVQWAYGLDEYHVAHTGTATNKAMQQATVNVLADMGAQPVTLMTGLVRAVESTDSVPPTVTITAPTSGSHAPVGSPVTITGTAVDSGGGVVAAVEYSTDGGTTWRPATGRASWSAVVTPMALGSYAIKVRAVDDSCNIGQPATVTVQGVARAYPCSIWPEGTVPATPATNETTPLEVGVKFRASEPGFVRGIRFYKGAGNTGTHVGHLWTVDGRQLAEVTFTGETASGWQTAPITPVAIEADQTYVVSVFMPNGHPAGDTGYFSSPFALPPLRALGTGEDGANGVFRDGQGMPNQTYGASNYWVDISFSDDDATAPTVISTTPSDQVQAVGLGQPVQARFSEGMTGSSVKISLRDADGQVLTGTMSYDATTRTASLAPSQPLRRRTWYTARVDEAKDRSGASIAAPVSWRFQTVAADDDSPATLWDSSATPDRFVTERSAVEVGTKITTSADGTISSIRFYKAPGSEGTHVGHLWTLDGQLLGSASFDPSLPSGWQQAPLTAPVAVRAGTTLVASVFAPQGVYAATGGYFTTARTRGPLTAPVAGNGVYRYGGGAVPTSTWNQTSYWVDVVLDLPDDTTAPKVVSVEPAKGVHAVTPGSGLAATFEEAVVESTVQWSVRTAAGAIAGTTSYDAATRTTRFAPSSTLPRGATVTASVRGADRAGNLGEARQWSFVVDSEVGRTPATLWTSADVPTVASVSDTGAIEVGVRFRPDGDGTITSIRFYKGPGNGGTHVGHLWRTDGTLLATAVFADESATGWQEADFATPVPVTGGTEYVASYQAPQGRYAASSGALKTARTRGPLTAPASATGRPNGVFASGAATYPTQTWNATSYGVDVVFVDATAPEVSGRTPAPGDEAIPVASTVTATFSEPVVSSSIVFGLRDPGGAAVPASVAYDATERTATLTPSSPLASATRYTATVSGAKDADGNAMTAPSTWSFTTATAGEQTVWPDSVVPAKLDSGDTGSVELGMKFRVTAAGSVTALRFYKGGSGNAGPHVVNLWGPDGTRLATATSSAESARGWQRVKLSTPVTLTPGTIYVVSYFAPSGRYSVDGGYFNAGTRTSGAIEALGNGVSGGNGLYRYGTSSTAMPTGSYNGANYWVDVVFVVGA